MIEAVGVDIVEVERIKVAMTNPRFIERILTGRELHQNLTPKYLAGRWAAKEAVAKAVGTHLTWHDVEIVPGSDGRPVATVRGLAEGMRIHVSISHEKGHAVGIAVLESTVR